MDKQDKVKVEIEREILNQLIKLKEVGDTYSDVIRKLLRRK
jgi:predicted CopG family antitoxin